MQGIYLVSPHGSLVISGEKTHIVKKRLFGGMINRPLVLVEDKVALGIIELGEPEKIDKNEFIRTYNKHRVSEEEAEKWWGSFRYLYLYPVKVLFKFEEPIEVDVPRGVQTFVDVSIPRKYLPEWLKYDKTYNMAVNKARVHTIIKEVMDYGEWEKHLERLRRFVKFARGYLPTYYVAIDADGTIFDIAEFPLVGRIIPGAKEAIDADGTIFDIAEFPLVGRIIPGAKEAIDEIRRMGYKIIIWSSRNNTYWNTPAMSRLAMKLLKIALDINHIKYDKIDYGQHGKVVADFYIDDRAITFRGNWDDTLLEFKKRVRMS